MRTINAKDLAARLRHLGVTEAEVKNAAAVLGGLTPYYAPGPFRVVDDSEEIDAWLASRK